MVLTMQCPVCGETRELEEDAPVGARRWCRCCGAVVEITQLQPLQVVPVRRSAEDFGV